MEGRLTFGKPSVLTLALEGRWNRDEWLGVPTHHWSTGVVFRRTYLEVGASVTGENLAWTPGVSAGIRIKPVRARLWLPVDLNLPGGHLLIRLNPGGPFQLGLDLENLLREPVASIRMTLNQGFLSIDAIYRPLEQQASIGLTVHLSRLGVGYRITSHPALGETHEVAAFLERPEMP